MTLPETVPAKFIAGETLKWRKSLPDYPATEWTLTYQFRSANGGATGQIDATATADGTGFVVIVPAATTAELMAGVYYFRAFVAKAGEVFAADQGQTQCEAAFYDGAAFDGRSQARRILEAIDAMIEGTASINQKRYQINNRELERYELTELIALRTKYAQLIAREQQAERLKAGKGYFRTVHTRFTRLQ